jgi:hypothetical protein
VCTLIAKEGLGFRIYLCSTGHSCGSVGTTFMRERSYGEWLWILNMIVRVVSGVLMRVMGCKGWGSGRILGGFGGNCLAILDLRWGMAPKFIFGMMFGVGLKLSRHLFWTCIACFKDIVVADHLELSSPSHQWNINFLKAAHD